MEPLKRVSFPGTLIFIAASFCLCSLFCISNSSSENQEKPVEKWKQSKFYPLLIKREINLPFYKAPINVNSAINRPSPVYLSAYPLIANSNTGSGSTGYPPVWPSFPSVPSSAGNSVKNKSSPGLGSSSNFYPSSKGSSSSSSGQGQKIGVETDSDSIEEFPSKSGSGNSNRLPSASAGGDNKPSTSNGDSSTTNNNIGNKSTSNSNKSSSKSGNPTSGSKVPSNGSSNKTDGSKNPLSPSDASASFPGFNKDKPLENNPKKPSISTESNNCSKSGSEESYEEENYCTDSFSTDNPPSLTLDTGKGNSTNGKKPSPPVTDQLPTNANSSEATTSKSPPVTEVSLGSDTANGGKGSPTKSCTSTNVGNHKLNFDYNWKIAGFFDYAKDSEKYAYPFAFKLENLTLKPDELPGSWFISLTQEPAAMSVNSVWSLNVTYETMEDAQTYMEVSVTAKVGIKTYSYMPMHANHSFNEVDTKEEGNSKNNNNSSAPAPTIHSYVAFWEDIKEDRHKESIVSSSSTSKETLELVFNIEALIIPKQLNSTDNNC